MNTFIVVPRPARIQRATIEVLVDPLCPLVTLIFFSSPALIGMEKLFKNVHIRASNRKKLVIVMIW